VRRDDRRAGEQRFEDWESQPFVMRWEEHQTAGAIELTKNAVVDVARQPQAAMDLEASGFAAKLHRLIHAQRAHDDEQVCVANLLRQRGKGFERSSEILSTVDAADV